jgi:hypothetical protein
MEYVMGVSGDLRDSDHRDQSVEGDGCGDDFAFPDSWIESDPESWGDLAPVPMEAAGGTPHHINSEFDVNSQGDIQVSRIRRRGLSTAAEAAAYITEDDFDDEVERDAFLLINGYKRILFDTGYSTKERDAAIRFFFAENPLQLRVVDAIAAISREIRVDVFLLRLVYEMYLREFRLQHAFPFDEVACPDRVIGNAGVICGDDGIWTISTVWRQPGITAIELFEQAVKDFPRPFLYRLSGEDDVRWVEAHLRAAVERLVLDHVISTKLSEHEGQLGEFLYVTGRNPVVELEERARETRQRVREANFTWSRLF